jgi:PAS domain S-box-containing protein
VKLHADELEARFEGILAIAADAIITIDESQRIVHFNYGAEKIFGYAASEIIGQPLTVLLPERFRAAHPKHVAEFAAGAERARLMGHRREVAGLRKGGIEFPAEASISKLGLPGRLLLTVVLRDVSERKHLERFQQLLAEAGAILATSLDAEATLRTVAQLPVPVLADCCLVDIVEVERDGTRRIRRVASRHSDPKLDAALQKIVGGPPLTWDTPSRIVDVLRGRIPYMESEIRPGSNPLPLAAAVNPRSLIIVPLIAREHVVGAMTIISTDPARRYGDADLALAQELAVRAAFALDNAALYHSAQRANRLRDEVLGVVSHDLRNPLSVISMCTHVLIESPPQGEAERRDLLSTIDESAQWMQRMISDLLDVSVIEAGALSLERHEVDVAALIERVVQMFSGAARDKSVALYEDVPPDVPTVNADEGRLLQLLANLVMNAIKFTEAGGRITVGARLERGSVVLCVEDTGPGIPPEHLPHIFERYWHAKRTARTRGSGLGLAIVKGITEAHGGTVTVKSEVGKGTTFAITLPAERDG